MSNVGEFVLRDDERGYNKILSQALPIGPALVPRHSTYVSGHPDAYIIRRSSFNFHEYQTGHDGLGKIRCFGDEIFSPNGAGYNMHPHHNFIIMCFVLQGTLTHVNDAGSEGIVDFVKPGDYYCFSTGAGGKHSELNIHPKDEMHAIYIWVLPDRLHTPPTYEKRHFDPIKNKNNMVCLIGNHEDKAIPVEQDLKISRLNSDANHSYTYELQSEFHGAYVFVIEGSIKVGDYDLHRRDSIAKYGINKIPFEVTANSTDVLIVETIL